MSRRTGVTAQSSFPRLRLKAAAFVAGLGSILLVAVGVGPALAVGTTSAPVGSAAHIEGYYGHTDPIPLRTGTSTFGLIHIKLGGTYRNTANHETTSYARGLWTQAIDEGYKDGTSWGGEVYSKYYQTPGGRKRIMCVIVDPHDYTLSGHNYGFKGIITAFWVSGWSQTTHQACTGSD